MFICEACLNNYQNVTVFRSYGKCEDCGEIGSCADIHHSVLRKVGFIDQYGIKFDTAEDCLAFNKTTSLEK